MYIFNDSMHIVHETKKYNRDKGKKNDRKEAS